MVTVKVQEGIYVNLITNLLAEEFSMNELKEFYRFRWDEETCFRELKHIIGAIDFYSKMVEYITHELWCRLILYNFCSQITSLVVIHKNERKYEYQVNFTMAYQTCREFLRRGSNGMLMNVLGLIEKYK